MMVRGVHVALLTGLAFALCLTAASAQGGKGKQVKPLQTWQAKVKDEALKKAAPADGFITTAKDFEALWKAWRGDEKVPEVDFKQNLVLVGLAGGPNLASIGASLDDEGNLKVLVRQTLIGGPGFGYQLAVVPRAGIKTVNGKNVPAP
jgi:hypothetical protein